MVDAFLAGKKAQLGAGDITPVTFKEYKATCDVIEKFFGRGHAVDALDFNGLRVALAKGKKKAKLGLVTLKRRLVIARMIFPNAGKPLKAPTQRLLRAAKDWPFVAPSVNYAEAAYWTSSVQHRLEERVGRVTVELDVDLRPKIVGEVIE